MLFFVIEKSKNFTFNEWRLQDYGKICMEKQKKVKECFNGFCILFQNISLHRIRMLFYDYDYYRLCSLQSPSSSKWFLKSEFYFPRWFFVWKKLPVLIFCNVDRMIRRFFVALIFSTHEALDGFSILRTTLVHIRRFKSWWMKIARERGKCKHKFLFIASWYCVDVIF